MNSIKFKLVLAASTMLGALLTMPLYDCIDQMMLCKKGRGVSIQRFYNLLVTDLYQFYTAKELIYILLRSFLLH